MHCNVHHSADCQCAAGSQHTSDPGNGSKRLQQSGIVQGTNLSEARGQKCSHARAEMRVYPRAQVGGYPQSPVVHATSRE